MSCKDISHTLARPKSFPKLFNKCKARVNFSYYLLPNCVFESLFQFRNDHMKVMCGIINASGPNVRDRITRKRDRESAAALLEPGIYNAQI